MACDNVLMIFMANYFLFAFLQALLGPPTFDCKFPMVLPPTIGACTKASCRAENRERS